MKLESKPVDLFANRNLDDFQVVYGDIRLTSAFQPIYQSTDIGTKIFGFEGLARPVIDNTPLSPEILFAGNSQFNKAALDRLSRHLHIRNFQRLNQKEGFLFLNINPAVFNSVEQVQGELEILAREIKAAKCTPSRIIFEIVENGTASDEIMRQLSECLRRTGGRIAIDDYGIDHSDWKRFELVQPDILKLDRAVFANLCKSPFAARALSQLTKSLDGIGSTLLVEGVETDRQFSICREAEVPLLQGYYFGLPQPVKFWLNNYELHAYNPQPSLHQYAHQNSIN